MYKVGTFSDEKERVQPGVYSKLNTGESTLVSAVTYGGVALPWPSYTAVSEPDPVDVRQNTVPQMATDTHLADPDTFRAIGANILRSANTVYLCQYNRRVVETLLEDGTAKRVPSEGWSADGNVHITAGFTDDIPSIARSQPLLVAIDLTEGNKYKYKVHFPWAAASAFAFEGELNRSELADGKPKPVNIDFSKVVGDDKLKKFLEAVYGKDKLTLTFVIRAELTAGTTVMVGGGSTFANAEAAKEINRFIQLRHPGLPAGALIAFDVVFEDGKDLATGPVLYIPGYTAPAGAACFAVADLHDGVATLTMYTHDTHTGKVDFNVLEKIAYAHTKGKSDANIDAILTAMTNIDTVPSTDEKKASSWAKLLDDGKTVRVGFASFHPLQPDSVAAEMDKFMSTAGKTGAGLIFYAPPADLFGKDVTQNKKQYQAIQNTYLEKTHSLCPATQLVMDETWMQGAHNWTEKTSQMTISSPFCVSTAGDARGGFKSLANSAYMVGLMARCGETRTATAARYPGAGSDLYIYTQKIIERMHDVGVMTWHSHTGEKMIYIDSSSYRLSLPGGGDPTKYPQAFERNRAVRAANKFRFEAAKMFISNYFEKNWYGDDAENSIRNDILTLIRELADVGVFRYPSPSDVTVRNVSTRAYAADVRLGLIESPEILFLTLEV